MMANPFAYGKGCLLALLLSLGVAPVAQAQLATVRGRVVDRADQQPIPGANVVVAGEDGQLGTATDGNGYFVLARLRPGQYALAVTFVGYAAYRDTLDLAFNDSRALDVELEAEAEALSELVVEGEASGEQPQVAGLETIRPSALARVPMPGLSADLAAYVLTLPGVVSPGDQGGQLSVRGGTPTQNLVLLDGIPIYQPFHIVGFYSAFPADMIAYADVYTGGFPARYGGRISSAFDVRLRNGNKSRIAGAASIAPFLSSVRLEAPIVPGKASLVASVRESVIERISPDLLGKELPYRFGDLIAKFHAFLNQTSSVSFTALRTFDEGNLTGSSLETDQVRWTNQAVGGHFVYLPQEFAALFQMRFYHTRVESQYRSFDASARTSEAAEFGGEMGFVYYVGPAEVHAGLFGRSQQFQYDLGVRGWQREEYVTEGGLFLDAEFTVNRSLQVEPGLRFHAFPSRGQTVFEPRFRVDWQPGGATSAHVLSTAWGRYHQEVTGIYNISDVADAFVVWSPTLENEPISRATHLLASWQVRLRPWLYGTVSAYRKSFNGLALVRYGTVFDDAIGIDTPSGEAQGLDLEVSLTRPSWHGTLSYGLAGVRYRLDQGDSFRPPHDRRHQIGVLFRIVQGPYALSARWQFGSGLPFTQIEGYYDFVPLETPDARFRTLPGVVAARRGGLYRGQLPAYHRLDVSVERRFTFSHLLLTVQGGLINAYDRSNLFSYNFLTARQINQLPLIPSLGLRVEVR